MDIHNITLSTPVHDALDIPLHISDFDRQTQKVAARTDEAFSLLTDDDMSALYAEAMAAS